MPVGPRSDVLISASFAPPPRSPRHRHRQKGEMTEITGDSPPLGIIGTRLRSSYGAVTLSPSGQHYLLGRATLGQCLRSSSDIDPEWTERLGEGETVTRRDGARGSCERVSVTFGA